MSSDSASSNGGPRPHSAPTTNQRVVVVGYILALAVPPLGLAIGLVLAVRVRTRHGVSIVLLSIVAAAIWALLIGSGALNDTNQGY
ncbi:MAG: hypothetical protein JO027_04860 [Solirubrobacterales bacterium]|nr:hypothetical protein [Solirubrobacterales bacterium]